jgi:hypothetical protein
VRSSSPFINALHRRRRGREGDITRQSVISAESSVLPLANESCPGYVGPDIAIRTWLRSAASAVRVLRYTRRAFHRPAPRALFSDAVFARMVVPAACHHPTDRTTGHPPRASSVRRSDTCTETCNPNAATRHVLCCSRQEVQPTVRSKPT